MRAGLQPPMTRLSASWRTASVWVWVLAGLVGQNLPGFVVTRTALSIPFIAWCVAAVLAGLLISQGHRYASHVAGATLGAAIVAIVVVTTVAMLDEPVQYAEDMRPILFVGAVMGLGVLITPLVILGANPYPWRPSPPGWYPNPGAQGAVRYWDGSRFTDHTWAGAPSAPAPAFSRLPPPLPTLETRLLDDAARTESGHRPTDAT